MSRLSVITHARLAPPPESSRRTGLVSSMAFGAIGLVDTYPALLGCLCVQGVMAAAIQPAAVRSSSTAA
jgi:hypothetical protein